MIEALSYDFMRNALMAGLLASVICGIMGTLVVVNRIVFLSGGVAHAAYGGIGMAFFFGWPYLLGTLGFSLIAAMIMAAVTLRAKHRADTVIGVIWALGMAIGIILIDLTPGYHVDLMSYLFGSILTVPGRDLWIMGGMGLVIALLVGWYYQDLIAMSYDEEFARVRGVPVVPLYFLLIGLLAVTVVMVIQVVGLILVIALLTIPPFIMEPYARTLKQMMIGASLLGAVFTISGLWLAYAFDLTSGAAIIVVAGGGFFATRACESFRKLLRRGQTAGETVAKKQAQDEDEIEHVATP
ncbi:MAG: metal ABC transporter permease [Desulfobacterales bacterium]|jgi:zinc transport system permease protein|nr:metal ABC transporter permease [Desulfobacteraceae bacterium]MDY0311205.1 metal ABC transporter permease [Desulfobacterales bacterium]